MTDASRILITGANGLLGQYLVAALSGTQTVVLATAKGERRFPLPDPERFTYAELDITDRASVLALVNDFQPDIIMVTPSYMLALLDEFRAQGLDPRKSSLKIGIFGAEPWTVAMRA